MVGGGVVSPTPNPKAGGPPLVGCPRLLIQYIRSYPLYPEDFPPSATWGRAMPWWQGTHLTSQYIETVNKIYLQMKYTCNITLSSTQQHHEFTHTHTHTHTHMRTYLRTYLPTYLHTHTHTHTHSITAHSYQCYLNQHTIKHHKWHIWQINIIHLVFILDMKKQPDDKCLSAQNVLYYTICNRMLQYEVPWSRCPALSCTKLNAPLQWHPGCWVWK
jgi:hypothetical protein